MTENTETTGSADAHAIALLGTGTITLMASTLLRWDHPRGPAHCLARLRLLTIPSTDPSTDPGTAACGPGRAVIVLSELRANPRGRELLSDLPGVARAAAAALLPASPRPQLATIWLAHHGAFSTYDEAGPQTLTRLALSWHDHDHDHDHDHNHPAHPEPRADLHGHTLLDPDTAHAVSRLLALEPVEHLLQAWPPPLTPPVAGLHPTP